MLILYFARQLNLLATVINCLISIETRSDYYIEVVRLWIIGGHQTCNVLETNLLAISLVTNFFIEGYLNFGERATRDYRDNYY
jgi:hypothetical protein